MNVNFVACVLFTALFILVSGSPFRDATVLDAIVPDANVRTKRSALPGDLLDMMIVRAFGPKFVGENEGKLQESVIVFEEVEKRPTLIGKDLGKIKRRRFNSTGM